MPTPIMIRLPRKGTELPIQEFAQNEQIADNELVEVHLTAAQLEILLDAGWLTSAEGDAIISAPAAMKKEKPDADRLR